MNEDNSAEIAKLQKDIESKITEIRTLKNKIAELNTKVSKIAELEGALKNLNATIKLNEMKITELVKENTSKTSELKQTASTMQESQKEIDSLKQKLAEKDSDLAKLKESYDDVSKSSDGMNKQISELNSNIEMKNKVIENLNATITPLEANLKEKESQLKNKSTEFQDLSKKFTETDKKLKDKVEKLEKTMMKLEDLDKALDDKNKENSQLREWNDAKAHELMDKDNIIQAKVTKISDLSNQIASLTQKLTSINANFTEQVTKMKEKETHLFDFIQRYQTTVSDAIKGIQELTVQKVQSHNEFLVTMLQDLHKQELDSFLKQADLLDQKITAFQAEKIEIVTPTIDLPPITEEEPPEPPRPPAPSVKPSIPTPRAPTILPAPPPPSVRTIALKEAPTFEKKVKFAIEAEAVPEKPAMEEVIYLHFEEKSFVRVDRLPETGINLVLDEKNQKWIMSWSSDVGFVQQRTAERQARSIANAGVPVGKGRLGKGFALEMIGQNAIPDRLMHDQHEY